MAQSEPNKRKWIWLLCLLAAVHVFVYSAAFPFFNNVDEPAHFDLTVKYAHGEIPRKVEPFSDETVRDLALYGATFYLGSETNDNEPLPPPWKLAAEKMTAWIAAQSPDFKMMNYESSQPPLYYAVASAWWRLGGGLGFDERQKLYWLRFLNLPVIVLLVWLGWLAAREIFPDKIFPRIGVPAFIAFMPQGVFYSIQSDVLSPVCFGIAFVCLLRLFRAETFDWRLGVILGLALAATFLTKMTNLPLLAVSVVALAFFTLHSRRAGKLPKAVPSLLVLTICATLPALAWMFWCRENFGDLTGSQPKILFLDWTPKPFDEWFQHPIFTWYGAWIFLSNFLSEFWQGEMSWHRQALCLRGVSWFYEFITIGFLTAALAGIIRHSSPLPRSQYRALWFSLFLFAATIAFLIYISISIDFHDCLYPSRNFPYVVSGRLALGALIPFMLLFVFGLDRILSRLDLPIKFFVLVALNLVMLITEFATNGPAFYDEYNWFHV